MSSRPALGGLECLDWARFGILFTSSGGLGYLESLVTKKNGLL